jgi:hypothetical protein
VLREDPLGEPQRPHGGRREREAQLANQLEVSDHAPTGTTPQMTFAVTAA